MTGRDRRALVIGVCVTLIVLVGRNALPALFTWRRAAREAASRNEEKLDRAKLSLRRAAQVQDSLKSRSIRVVALAPALLGGGSPATASATLAGIVSGAAARSNVRIGALQLSADTATRGVFTRVSVHGDATGDIAGITAMLGALEGGPTLLAISELSITQPEPGAPSDHAEALRVELAVVGLMLRQSAGPSK
ncbi:MAG TPA: type II secretion system protein GspM [Gemmatimonadaceae bacterium]|nr:type II secretion system protein GspM [Gemmatimonadaceae bacterium]